MPFIVPAQPTAHHSPPRGIGWLHEFKFSGLRVQLHKQDDAVAIYTQAGHDCTRAYPLIAAAVGMLSAPMCVIDAVLSSGNGSVFLREQRLGASDVDSSCAWAFDLLALNGHDRRRAPLFVRKSMLAAIIYKANHDCIRLSETFDDGAKLLVAAERVGLAGVVSKQRVPSYRSGRKCGWIEVECTAWREYTKTSTGAKACLDTSCASRDESSLVSFPSRNRTFRWKLRR
jgi:bifunctional non-homologous end joining protein LigD